MKSPKKILSEKNLLPKKSFGQNFMMEENVNERICHLLEGFSAKSVLEIGAGTGSLTKALLKRAPLVYAIEKDRDMANILRENFHEDISNGSLILYEENAANFSLTRVFSTNNQGVMVANLPYHLTSSFILMAIKNYEIIQGGIFLIQKEVAQRLSAHKDEKAYGFLTVILQALFQVKKAFDVSRNCFWPVPKVDSAVILLQKKPNITLSLGELEGFILFVKAMFQKRRKKVSSILKALSLPLDKCCEYHDLRPENLSWQQFYELYQATKQ